MSGTIVALGGLSADHDDSPLRHFIVDAAQKSKPRICYVPLASGDYDVFVSLFYDQYTPSFCRPSHLELLRKVTHDPAEVLAAQDIVYLGGGSTPVLVAAMRVLGLDRVLRAVLQRGGVLCGDSAGAHVWFKGCITDSLGPDLHVFPDGLGLAEGTCVAHYDHERAAMLETALVAGELPGPAWGIEDGAAVALRGGRLEAVSARDYGGVHELTVQGNGVQVEPLNVRRL
ncbi:MAG: Type 1 glutamine amidotransferase-like domain-containing protein [Acidimicrobiales bacterium]